MSYFGNSPAAQGQEFLYILTNGATSVSGADSLGRVLAYASQGLVRVFLNGARLTPNVEYTATNGTTISFVGWTGSANDELLVEVLTGLVVADTLRPAQNLADVANAVTARANIGAAALLNPLATIASAGTTDLGSVASEGVEITGTTTITSFGTVAAGTVRFGRFTGALTLTHNATSLILPGGANITTAAGDRFWAVSLGSGNWFVLDYIRASGQAIVQPASVAQGTAKAWFNLNGTGTIAERDSFNFSSYVDNGVGDYSGNIATAMPNANYNLTGGAPCSAASSALFFPNSQTGFNEATPTTSSCRVFITNGSFSASDRGRVAVTIHGDPA